MLAGGLLDRGSSGHFCADGLLVQVLHVEVSFLGPGGPSDVPEPGGGEVKAGLAVRERANHSRAPADLFHQPFERIVRPDAAPVLGREGVIAQRLVGGLLDQIGCGAHLAGAEFADDLCHLSVGGGTVLAGMDRLEHIGRLAHLGGGDVVEDVTIPMHGASPPAGIGEDLGGTLVEADTGIRGDELDTLEAARLEVLEEPRPARLILLRAFADAEDIAETLRIHPDGDEPARHS